MSQVKLVIPELIIGEFKAGGVIRVSESNPEWGSVMLNHETYSFNDGAMFKSRRVAFFRSELKNIEVIAKLSSELKEGEDFNKKLVKLGVPAMKIVRRETFEPQFEGHTHKIKGEEGEDVIVDGKLVFMQDILVPVTSEETDTLLRNTSTTTAATVDADAAVAEEGADGG